MLKEFWLDYWFIGCLMALILAIGSVFMFVMDADNKQFRADCVNKFTPEQCEVLANMRQNELSNSFMAGATLGMAGTRR